VLLRVSDFCATSGGKIKVEKDALDRTSVIPFSFVGACSDQIHRGSAASFLQEIPSLRIIPLPRLIMLVVITTAI